MLCCMPETPAEDVAPQKPIEGPDWSAVEFHPQCPLCEYDLFGLSAPRCPECGYGFEWRDVLDPRAAEHPYLFEYQSRRRIRSFVRTAWHAAAPRGFWKSLHPSLRPRAGRLVTYFVAGLFLHVIAILIAAFLEVAAMYASWGRMSFIYKPSPGGGAVDRLLSSMSDALSTTHLYPEMYLETAARFAGAPVLMIALILVSLASFRFSMKRARIKTSHVLRCITYSLDPFGWAVTGFVLSLLLVVLILAGIPQVWDSSYSVVLAIIWIPYSMIRLYCAYRFYLRFEPPFATLSAVAIIVTLLFAIMFPADLVKVLAFVQHGVWLY
jgi:hypothetical protein